MPESMITIFENRPLAIKEKSPKAPIPSGMATAIGKAKINTRKVIEKNSKSCINSLIAYL